MGLQCEALVRLLMPESPKQIAAARDCTVDHTRNVINSIVHKSSSVAGVPGVVMQAAAILMPQELPASLDAIRQIINSAQEKRRGPTAEVCGGRVKGER